MIPENPDARSLLLAFTQRTNYSQEDIARHANVSVRTVNNVAAGRGSEDTRRKVIEAIEKLDLAEPVGGLEITYRVHELEARVDDLSAKLDRLAAHLLDRLTPPAP